MNSGPHVYNSGAGSYIKNNSSEQTTTVSQHVHTKVTMSAINIYTFALFLTIFGLANVRKPFTDHYGNCKKISPFYHISLKANL